MVRDTASSHLHIASSYEDSEDDSSEIMKRPLITATWSSNASLEAEEQTRLEKDKQQGKLLARRAFLLGCALGFVLQVMAFATCYTILKIWRQNPTFPGSLSLVSYWMLVLLSRLVDIGIYLGLLLTFLCIRTKSGSLYMRKKLDQDVDSTTPAGSNSMWTAHNLYVAGIYFWGGAIVATFSLWAIVDLSICMVVPYVAVVPLVRLLMTVVVIFLLFWIMIKSLDWGYNIKSGREEQEDEEEGMN
jgi:hypothetical protein